MASNPSKPPANGAQLRKQLIAQFGISSAAGLAVVDTAARALDQARAAERRLQKVGLTVVGARGSPDDPEYAQIRSARLGGGEPIHRRPDDHLETTLTVVDFHYTGQRAGQPLHDQP